MTNYVNLTIGVLRRMIQRKCASYNIRDRLNKKGEKRRLFFSVCVHVEFAIFPLIH